MHAVWSFWSKPFFAFKGRIWREPVHHLLAWGLSVRLARQHYPETHLVTDEAGADLLVERLGLRFSRVSTELEGLRQIDLGWWALGKILAYSLQEKPFVHMDSDVFLWKALPAALANAAVFSQCPEEHRPDEWSGPRDIEAVFSKHALELPAEWEWARSQSNDSFREENCGIVGGNRLDFIRYYASLALDLVRAPAHRAAWAELPDKSGYNMLIEQFLLAACIDYYGIHPESPFRGIRGRHLFPSFGAAFDQRVAARVGYTHLMGDAKGDLRIVQRLEQRVQRDDPAFYRHCRRLAERTPTSGLRVG